MMTNRRFIYRFLIVFFLLFAGAVSYAAIVNANGWERDRYNSSDYDDDDDDDDDGTYSPIPKDSIYSVECGSCHFLYFPGLLPEKSWIKLMAQTDHFGEDLGLAPEVSKEITAYLVANSADKNRETEWSSKIMRSLSMLSPMKVTEVPYIARKHSKIKREVFSRPSVKTLSNCGACHRTGAEGDFEEDGVKIPR